MGEGFISVVTILWRNENFIRPFLDSIQPPTPSDIQLIVVQNGPEGVGLESFVSHARSLNLRDVVSIRLECNTGFTGGMNHGFVKAEGGIVIFANLDLRFNPRFFKALKESNTISSGILIPQVYQESQGILVQGMSRTFTHRLKPLYGNYAPQSHHQRRVDGGPGACIIATRSVLKQRVEEEGHIFDAAYHSFAEDQDLFWWACRKGIPIVTDSELNVTHTGGGSLAGGMRYVGRPRWVQIQSIANYRINCWKHTRGLKDRLGWMIGEIISLVKLLVSRGPRDWLPAYAASWKETLRILDGRNTSKWK